MLGLLLLLPITMGWTLSGPSTPDQVQPVFPPQNVAPLLSKLDHPLARYLETAKDDDYIPVVLILERQLTEPDKVRLFTRIKADKAVERKREQRRLLISELKRLAQAEQAQLLAFLRDLEKQQQVRNVRPLWLANVIGVTAPKGVIYRLTAFKEIRSLHLDLPRPVKGEIVWGVTQIQADAVWNLMPMGYNGTGVTVAILDAGVDYNHGDLVQRTWINTGEDIDKNGRFTTADLNGVDDDGNGYVDDVVGYNFSGAGSANPADVNGHGTHVAGTVAGDGTGGSSTGVAPGARLMALRESNTSGLSTQQECWEGMQYALANGADVLNFSSGWRDAWSPVYATWRNMIHNLMDGGVLFVTIAHNDSSSLGVPRNVRTPGRVPLALTVGATDGSDVIASFSNRGPVTWQTVAPFFDYPWPPGLTKPEVTAPGVNIKSTRAGGGYTLRMGTSMAAPHVAGAAALLLHKNPGLTPYQLKFLLEETAVDLGAAGPDNVYGWGRVHALNALNYAIAAPPYDLSITGTSPTWTSVDIWVDNNDDGTPDTPLALSNNHLYARVRNVGGQVVTNVELKFYCAEVSTSGVGGFDPNGDGDPADGTFTYIGSYRVPILGPGGSGHDTAIGLVNWNIPTPTSDHWCVGVGVVAPSPPNPAETNTVNNRALRNCFDLRTGTTGFAFRIAPPAEAPSKPFGVEFLRQYLPKQARVELIFDKAFERQLMVHPQGIAKVEDPLLKLQSMGRQYLDVLERSIPEVRYELTEGRAVLFGLLSPKGESYPVRLNVHVPEKVASKEDARIVINTLNQQSERVGGLTLHVLQGTAYQQGGPHPPQAAR
ncbi:MAG: S8 family serine peptidase [Gemmataceae bacterium]|nr:S8 family serine peptidase [Gemmataceae bacterium]